MNAVFTHSAQRKCVICRERGSNKQIVCVPSFLLCVCVLVLFFWLIISILLFFFPTHPGGVHIWVRAILFFLFVLCVYNFWTICVPLSESALYSHTLRVCMCLVLSGNECLCMSRSLCVSECARICMFVWFFYCSVCLRLLCVCIMLFLECARFWFLTGSTASGVVL